MNMLRKLSQLLNIKDLSEDNISGYFFQYFEGPSMSFYIKTQE